MFQYIFEETDKFGWWDLDIILAYTGTQFTSTYLQKKIQNRGVCLTLAPL